MVRGADNPANLFIMCIHQQELKHGRCGFAARRGGEQGDHHFDERGFAGHGWKIERAVKSCFEQPAFAAEIPRDQCDIDTGRRRDLAQGHI